MLSLASVAAKVATPTPAGPSRSDMLQEQSWNFGDWTVATGGGDAQGGATGLDLPPWMILAAVVVVALAWKNRKG